MPPKNTEWHKCCKITNVGKQRRQRLLIGREMKNSSTTIVQMETTSAPEHGTRDSTIELFTDMFDRRQQVLLLTIQLIQMIKAVQRHRGMSMGLLGGNKQFNEELLKLQGKLKRRLSLFLAFAAKTQNLLVERDCENLESAWLTISHNWQQDAVIDNYELHCHLIEHLLTLLNTLSRQLESPMSAILASQNETLIVHATGAHYPKRLKQLEVLHFSTRLMPAVAEQIGRIRALATYVAALGSCDADFTRKLQYVVQCTRINNEKLKHQAKRMENILDKDSPLLSPLKSYEIKLNFLLNMVEQDVLKENGMTTADSNRLYEIATNIIDMYLHIVDEGVKLLEHWHHDEIENWLLQSD
jgi:hypothetical protein